MTHSFEKPKPLPFVEEGDLLTLAADVGFGIFTAATLYDWYSLAVRQSGREPVSKKAFGTVLKNVGWVSSVKYMDGQMRRCWVVNKPWARRGLEYVSKEHPDSEQNRGVEDPAEPNL